MSRLVTVWLTIVLSASAACADARKDCFEKSGSAAIAACTLAIQANPRDAVSYVNRAYEYLQKGDYARTLADYSKAIELDSTRADAYQGRAWAYLKMGKPDLALPDASKSLDIKPRDARALDTRGHVFEALGRRQEATADFRAALAIEPRMQGSTEGLQRLERRP
jgi:tetratricopeptide (TPR) repeat protein